MSQAAGSRRRWGRRAQAGGVQAGGAQADGAQADGAQADGSPGVFDATGGAQRDIAYVEDPASFASFEALFRSEFPTMFRLAHLLRAADPENIVQEAFVRLHGRWRDLTDVDRAGGYLRTTVVNLCRSEARHEAVALRHDRSMSEARANATEASAEDAALQSVSDAALLSALDALAPRHREALVLRFWLDLSEAQMADAMGCSTGSVKAHVSRGLAALRDAIQDRGDGA